MRTLAHRQAFNEIYAFWRYIENEYGRDGQRLLGKADRYYLLARLLGRHDMLHPWLYDRTRMVERDPDGCLDLWAREHYKSTIITYAGCIQEIILDPEITIGIFSHTKPVARKFLLQIKMELESNARLHEVYPDIFYRDPKNESPKWSEEKGLVVRRKTNPKEATLEAHGLVDGQPTGAHFRLRVYDDVVTRESVSTPEQVQKTTEAWQLSDNLGARSDSGKTRAWHIGTRYSYADTYQHMLDKRLLTPRIFAATDTGELDGKPVFLSEAAWEDKKRTQGPSVCAAQMLQNPAAGNEAMFRKEWLQYIDIRPATLNVYVMCDPARSRKKESDNTALAVVGVDAARNKYLLDGYRHKMGLAERWTTLRNLRRYWLSVPGVQNVRVGYERYGMQSDIEYFEEMMVREGDGFEIVELAWPLDGPGSKADRVQRLQPDFFARKFYLPLVSDDETVRRKQMRESGQSFRIFKDTRRRDQDGHMYSLTQCFIDEFVTYPFSTHDDFIDATSRIYDMEPVPPVIIDQSTLEPEAFAD